MGGVAYECKYTMRMDGFGRVDDIQIVMIILITKTTKVCMKVLVWKLGNPGSVIKQIILIF